MKPIENNIIAPAIIKNDLVKLLEENLLQQKQFFLFNMIISFVKMQRY